MARLYNLISRAHRGERGVLEQLADPAVSRINLMASAVRRDTHKMRAFVRFRAVEESGVTRHVAWFEPDHFIVEANAAFFVRRFATMTWSILTPYRSVHWDGTELRFATGAKLADVPDDDALARYWSTYFAAIFNPARLKVGAMTSEMPKKYWRNLPEAAAIPELVRGAQARTGADGGSPHDLAPAPDEPTGAPGCRRPDHPARPRRRRGRRMPALRPLAAGDAGRVRRGAGDRRDDAGGRATWRPGGFGGPSIRRSGGADAGPGPE